MNQKNTKIDKAIIPPSLWRLAWPTTIANLLLASVGFIQILLATQFGTEATAAVTVAAPAAELELGYFCCLLQQ